nr:11714_t:CDS:2 [Entrophospora candida]CAG8518847.1 11708_t:CDS:2 [Entrophospora candida]
MFVSFYGLDFCNRRELSNNNSNANYNTKYQITEQELSIILTRVFEKIGQTNSSKEGIQELYTFLLEYPEYGLKVDAFIASAGTFFHKYIQNALAEIATCEMRAHGLLPKEAIINKNNKLTTTTMPIQNDKSFETNSNHFPYHNNCEELPNSALSRSTMSTPEFNLSGNFREKIARETFEQTRSRLHNIFQYEKYKSGLKRSSLPSLREHKNNSERLEFAKNIIVSRKHNRTSTWANASSLLSSTDFFITYKV